MQKPYTESYIRRMGLPLQRKVAEQWAGELRAQGKSERTISVYMQVLRELARKHKKPFKDLTKADLVKFLGGYQNLNYRNLLGTVTKAFLKWLYQTEEAPDIIRWWKPKQDHKTIPAESMLSQSEIKEMLALIPSIRDRCMVSLMYDSGCRLGELLPLCRDNIQFTEHGVVITVSGKTGMRRLLLVNSAPIVRDIMNSLPNQPKINLWTGLIGKELNPSSVRLIVKKAGARINRDVHPHLLRHSRASHLALKMSETGLRVRFGWRPDSGMPKLYVHVSGKELDAEFMKAEGVKLEETPDQLSQLAPIPCPVCKLLNDASFSYCAKCGSSLLPLEGGIEKFTNDVSRLLSDPSIDEAMRAWEKANASGIVSPHLQRQAEFLKAVAVLGERQTMLARLLTGQPTGGAAPMKPQRDYTEWAKAELGSIKRKRR